MECRPRAGGALRGYFWLTLPEQNLKWPLPCLAFETASGGVSGQWPGENRPHLMVDETPYSTCAAPISTLTEPPSGPRNYGARDPLDALFQARLKTSDRLSGRAKAGFKSR